MGRIVEYKPGMIMIGEDEVESGFEGSVEIEMPTYPERIKLIKEHGLHKVSDDNAIDQAEKMLDIVAKRVKSVTLFFGGEAIDNLDELGMSAEGAAVINDIGKTLISGYRLGKS